ncbi:endonuclease/exonuclease/phosphatase family protein [Synoicihabitans lomoniglobus]|uniref:Endonuclease/exonuclease/phosphatase family protein n=1 Tax=Synoicihabitans lomoniglobus TaxID=2909285 RepID=A0AAF0CQW5_9BACT|nr:endonuclease/exonuclease/phosphatase family protein [Opitutaceae bacterium LMO-M01]WED66393.1 endonuclease/exonuclease/phosphatase family protein [Opitutaceae bacterium LMO-M01]
MLAKYFVMGLSLIWGAGVVSAAQSFTVVVYNVENLHDADGVAVYDDYQPDHYRPAHVVTKVSNIAAILQKFRGGAGPDIVMLQEIEIDQTPESRVGALEDFVISARATPLSALSVDDGARLAPEWKGAPAEAWLLKAMADAGLSGYHVVVGSDAPAPDPSAGGRAIKCVTLTKFPVRAVREHAISSARNILEVEVEVEGQTLFVFNNHWKSGASDPSMETLRIENATVLRRRLDEILTTDPQADIVVGGDFNAQYNQKPRYPDMPRTSINDVLKAQGSETALQTGAADFYNLWYELEPEQRGSDVYRGEWGTLMHLVVSRGLYDEAGVQYQDNSFRVARLMGVNADLAGAPRRWDSSGPGGSGFSDHLPTYAHFRTVDSGLRDKWMALDHPSDAVPTANVLRVNYAGADLNQAIDVASLPDSVDLKDGSWRGKLFKVRGTSISDGRNLKVRTGGVIYDVYAPPRDVRDVLQAQHTRNRVFEFYGELGTYKGNWQFVVHDISWVR